MVGPVLLLLLAASIPAVTSLEWFFQPGQASIAEQAAALSTRLGRASRGRQGGGRGLSFAGSGGTGGRQAFARQFSLLPFADLVSSSKQTAASTYCKFIFGGNTKSYLILNMNLQTHMFNTVCQWKQKQQL